jgi:hypothetical protein
VPALERLHIGHTVVHTDLSLTFAKLTQRRVAVLMRCCASVMSGARRSDLVVAASGGLPGFLDEVLLEPTGDCQAHCGVCLLV